MITPYDLYRDAIYEGPPNRPLRRITGFAQGNRYDSVENNRVFYETDKGQAGVCTVRAFCRWAQRKVAAERWRGKGDAA